MRGGAVLGAALALALAALALAAPRAAHGFDNGAPHSRLPPLGWSSWDALAAGADHPIRDFCDTVSVKAAADAYVATGLYEAGYRHLHLDDCWAGHTRNATGFIQPDPARFPGGMKEVVDYVHSKGLTFGLYTSAGKTVCVGGRVGSQGHWTQDAQVFAEWGVDWVKMDWCGGASDVKGSYASMSKALNESGRHIALNMCRGDLKPWSWIDAYAQSWRVTEDHSGKWSQPAHGIKQGIATALQIPRDATGKPYGWNDMDMLQTGTGPASGFDPTLGPPNVTLDESITEFSMWAILASPLLFTTPIMNCTSADVSVAPPSTCSCTKKLSTKAACVEGETFGCLPNGTMWAVGCRGIFTCNGVQGVTCNVNMPDPPRNHTCPCKASPSPHPKPPSSPPMTPKHCTPYLLRHHPMRLFGLPLIYNYSITRRIRRNRYLNPTQKLVLLNKEILEINQQITPQGFPTIAGDSTVWARTLSDGSIAVALYNEDDVPKSIGTSLAALGWPSDAKATVRDLWTHTDNGTIVGTLNNVTVRAHATVVVRLHRVRD